MGELKNRKWELNAHLVSSLYLNESQPLDLRVTQKVIWKLKGEEKRKRSIHSFMSIWEKEKREQGENFWAVRNWKRATRRHFSKSGQQCLLACIPRKNRTAGERHRNRGRGTASSGHIFRGWLYNIKCCFIAVKNYVFVVCWLARFSRWSSSTEIEIRCNLWLLEFLLCILVSL